jgi:hypothetical protein
MDRTHKTEIYKELALSKRETELLVGALHVQIISLERAARAHDSRGRKQVAEILLIDAATCAQIRRQLGE